MANIAQLLTEHIDIWTGAETEKKSGRGRARGNGGSVYGVKKLRELILELAVRGKLVSQDSNDEPASELLKRIQAEKAKLIAEGKLKKEKPLASISEIEKPFELPNGWVCIELQELINPSRTITYGVLKPGSNTKGGIPLIKTENVYFNKIDTNFTSFISEELDKEFKRTKLEGGEILLTLVGSIGRCAIASDLLVGANISRSVGLIDIYHEFNKGFVVLALTALINERYIEENCSGTAQVVLNVGTVNKLPFVVPPLAEQHRIVAKVDELMALCDQLEQQHSNAQEAHETLISQLLATLTQSQSAAEFNANWQRIYANFDVLFITEASIDALKQTLLQLAVMGKLVPQDPNDEPASELLKRIQAEKIKLIAEGKLKKEKPLAPIAEDEKPFELPEGWEWVRFQDISAYIQRGKGPEYVDNSPFIVVSQKCVRWGGIDLEVARFISPESLSKYEKIRFLQTNDLLWNSTGTGTIGRACLFQNSNLSQKCVADSHVTIVRTLFGIEKFLLRYIQSPIVQNEIEEMASGTTNQIELNTSTVIAHLLPLPPLAEQHRIVAKVDALMALCDQLKTRLQQASQQQQAIADALVAQALLPQSAEVIDFVEYRMAVACYTIKKMCPNPAFGRTQVMKLLYLAQSHVGIPMQMQFEREAAGPLDKWIYEFERLAESKQWFKVVEKSIGSGKTKFEYQITPAITAPSAMIESVCSIEQRMELDRLLGLFADKNTEEAEIIATLFAAWNDFLMDGKSPTDDAIVQEVRENWHERKARFSADELHKWLSWLRRNSLVPQGKSPQTIYQRQLIH